VGLRGSRALGHVFGKRLAAQGYGYEADCKCQQRHPLIYFSLPKPFITDPAARTAYRGSAPHCRVWQGGLHTEMRVDTLHYFCLS
jgi:hypothetical protein